MKAGNEKELIDSLFTNDGTVAVIIKKVSKRYVDFEFNNKSYRLNCWAVVCKGSPIEGGKTWWQHACLDFGTEQRNEIIESIIEYTGATYIPMDYERKYQYK